MREKYIEECKTIQQNCTYTAEAHHIIALRNKRIGFFLQVIPAVVAAVSGVVVVSGVVHPFWLALIVVGAATSAVAGVLDPHKSYQNHLSVAKDFVVLKQDARSLHETFYSTMNDEVFSNEVKHLHDRYISLVKMSPATDKKSFEKARIVVQKGLHKLDRDEEDLVK